MNITIKQEMTHVDIKTEVEDDNFENYTDVPIKVEIQTGENDFNCSKSYLKDNEEDSESTSYLDKSIDNLI